MKFTILVFLFFLLKSCAGITPLKPTTNFPEITPKELEVVRGHFTALRLPHFEGFEKKIYCMGQEIALERGEEHSSFLLAGPYYHDGDTFYCEIELIKGEDSRRSQWAQVTILPYPFESERLHVDRRHVDLSPEDLARVQGEREVLRKAYESVSLGGPFFRSNFSRPLRSVITSPYGRERVFNDMATSWHNGVDFRAPMNTPIPSSNRGRVIFAGDLFFNGKTVIIDHGKGIQTLYCHLNKIHVSRGDWMEKGDIVGLSGNTGRSTAPHLHWGVRVQGHWINGLALVEHSFF